MLKHLFLITFLLFPLSVFSGQKKDICVYTEENDVKFFEYCPDKNLIAKSISYQELIDNNKFKPSIINKPVEPLKPSSGRPAIFEINTNKKNEVVTLKISGCPTLQDSFDNKNASITNAIVVPILRHGRSIEQLCASIGRGCTSCIEISDLKP